MRGGGERRSRVRHGMVADNDQRKCPHQTSAQMFMCTAAGLERRVEIEDNKIKSRFWRNIRLTNWIPFNWKRRGHIIELSICCLSVCLLRVLGKGERMWTTGMAAPCQSRIFCCINFPLLVGHGHGCDALLNESVNMPSFACCSNCWMARSVRLWCNIEGDGAACGSSKTPKEFVILLWTQERRTQIYRIEVNC